MKVTVEYREECDFDINSFFSVIALCLINAFLYNTGQTVYLDYI